MTSMAFCFRATHCLDLGKHRLGMHCYRAQWYSDALASCGSEGVSVLLTPSRGVLLWRASSSCSQAQGQR